MTARRTFVALSVLLAVVVGAAAVAEARTRDGAAGHRGGVLRAAATYVGLTPRQLVTELRGGKSLAQVAAAQGKPVQGLRQVVIEALRTRIEAAVAAGRLPRARADAMLLRLPARVDRILNRTWSGHARVARLRQGVLQVAATYTGLTRAQLVERLRAGQSLAQIATAQGKSVDGLKQALLSALRARVEAAVAAGRITPAQAQRLLERAPARIDRLVVRTRR